MKTVDRPDGSKVLEIPVFASSEGEAALNDLAYQLRVRFRCVEGQPRAYMDQSRLVFEKPVWPRIIYRVYAFAAEQESDGHDWGPNLVAVMQYLFEEFYSRGARTIVWRRELCLEWASGGQLVPNKQSINCRCAFLDDAGDLVEPPPFASQLVKNEAMPMALLSEEVLRDIFNGRPPTIKAPV